jgi:choice-of-anchor B domain-containing protein
MRAFILLAFLFPVFLNAQNFNLTQRSVVTFQNQSLANVWGYTDGGQEFALIGAQLGMQIYNITDPDNPVYVTTIPGPDNLWKEIKTYNNYAYVVSEGGWGVQVVNLSGLITNTLPLPYQSVYPVIPGVGTVKSSHALQVDEAKGYLYLYGSKLTNNNGVGYPIILNLNTTPYTPTYAGRYTVSGYAHDGYANNDTLFASHIYAGQFSIVNTTNKSNPVIYGPNVTTPTAFTHNTWRTGNTIFSTDETSNSWLAAYNISDPTDVDLIDKIQLTPGSQSVVHNVYCHNQYAIASWYKDGIAIVDATRPGNLVVTGTFDTYPSGSGSGYDGCWGVYPYFPSGTIIASNIYGANGTTGELYILTPTYVRGCHLEGVVTNAQTGARLGNATVSLLGSGVANEMSSNEVGANKGTYKMARYGSGTFTLQVSLAGYMTYSAPVTLTTGALTIANVPLQPEMLPVELTRFQAQPATGQTALLTWATSSERENSGFDIQQSTDGTNWQSIGWVDGATNPGQVNQYSFKTEALTPADWIFRLAQKDIDGTITHSEWRTVTIENTKPRIAISPNPVTSSAQVVISSEQYASGDIVIELYQDDMKVLFSTIVHSEDATGSINIPLPVQDLPAGTYWVSIKQHNQVTTIPFIKQ